MRSYAVRLGILRVLVIVILAALLGRLWTLQVMGRTAYREAAIENQVRDIVVPAERGRILDAHGRVLVDNRTALVVTVDRITLQRQPDRGVAVLERLAAVLRKPYRELAARTSLCGPGAPPPCWNGSPYQPIPVAKDVLLATALAIEEQAELFPGVRAHLTALRDYPQPGGALAAHLLGYLSPITESELARLPRVERDRRRNDVVGRAGLEQVYERDLAGRAGVRRIAVDSLGGVTGTVDVTAPTPGNDLVTSLDARVQKALEDALGYGIDVARQRGRPTTTGAGVVLDARTGHVVAMGSYPAYRPEAFVGGISVADYRAMTDPGADVPLLSRALQGEYAPGSAFKAVSTAGLVMAGTASFTGRYPCPGSVTLGNRVFRNFEQTALGMLDLHTTLVKSCDTVYYEFARRDWYADEARIRAGQRPVEAAQRMARAFGLGRPTGVDLPSERAGAIDDRASKLARWKSYVRATACAGAKRRPPGDPLQRIDEENCVDGWRFRLGDQANFDIGQGTVLVTPLQLAAAYAALVNGGTVYSPRIGKAVVAPNGRVVRRITSPVRARLPVRADVRQQIVAELYDVPGWGTAAGAFAGFPLDRVAVGGKTGTAQVGIGNDNDTSWFASFAGWPGQPAQFVTVIAIPKGGQGARAAAPAVRRVWEAIYGLLPGTAPALPGARPPAALPRLGPAKAPR